MQFSSRELSTRAAERLSLQMELRTGIASGDLEVHYQPQFTAAERRLAGMEALVRWRHPVQGLLPPVLFIPLAEQSGLIGPLGEEVLRMVCQQITTWSQEGLPVVPVAVNVSAVQIMQGGLVDSVRGILAETGVSADMLVFEITESFLMTDREMAFATVNGLKDLGVKMSIDDFGTGYSSLSYLQGLHVDELKIDKSFVASMRSDAGSAIIARTVVALGHGLGLVVLAEGVETEDQAALLLEYGCDLYQGFLFSRPVPPDEVRRFLTSS
jgi:EAL domain-containing protein (putative c-di-GMP-specific phosphodiesterase class I)